MGAVTAGPPELQAQVGSQGLGVVVRRSRHCWAMVWERINLASTTAPALRNAEPLLFLLILPLLLPFILPFTLPFIPCILPLILPFILPCIRAGCGVGAGPTLNYGTVTSAYPA